MVTIRKTMQRSRNVAIGHTYSRPNGRDSEPVCRDRTHVHYGLSGRGYEGLETWNLDSESGARKTSRLALRSFGDRATRARGLVVELGNANGENAFEM